MSAVKSAAIGGATEVAKDINERELMHSRRHLLQRQAGDRNITSDTSSAASSNINGHSDKSKNNADLSIYKSSPIQYEQSTQKLQDIRRQLASQHSSSYTRLQKSNVQNETTIQRLRKQVVDLTNERNTDQDNSMLIQYRTEQLHAKQIAKLEDELHQERLGFSESSHRHKKLTDGWKRKAHKVSKKCKLLEKELDKKEGQFAYDYSNKEVEQWKNKVQMMVKRCERLESELKEKEGMIKVLEVRGAREKQERQQNGCAAPLSPSPDRSPTALSFGSLSESFGSSSELDQILSSISQKGTLFTPDNDSDDEDSLTHDEICARAERLLRLADKPRSKEDESALLSAAVLKHQLETFPDDDAPTPQLVGPPPFSNGSELQRLQEHNEAMNSEINTLKGQHDETHRLNEILMNKLIANETVLYWKASPDQEIQSPRDTKQLYADLLKTIDHLESDKARLLTECTILDGQLASSAAVSLAGDVSTQKEQLQSMKQEADELKEKHEQMKQLNEDLVERIEELADENGRLLNKCQLLKEKEEDSVEAAKNQERGINEELDELRLENAALHGSMSRMKLSSDELKLENDELYQSVEEAVQLGNEMQQKMAAFFKTHEESVAEYERKIDTLKDELNRVASSKEDPTNSLQLKSEVEALRAILEEANGVDEYCKQELMDLAAAKREAYKEISILRRLLNQSDELDAKAGDEDEESTYFSSEGEDSIRVDSWDHEMGNGNDVEEYVSERQAMEPGPTASNEKEPCDDNVSNSVSIVGFSQSKNEYVRFADEPAKPAEDEILEESDLGDTERPHLSGEDKGSTEETLLDNVAEGASLLECDQLGELYEEDQTYVGVVAQPLNRESERREWFRAQPLNRESERREWFKDDVWNL